MYRFCTIFLFTSLVLISCGSPLKRGPENLKAELDTSLYNKYIQKGPDTDLYPVFLFTSSQRIPVEKFGPSAMFDDKKETWWSSGVGLNSGEWIEMHVKNFKAATCRIIIASDQVMARVNTVTVWINDSLYGKFPSNAPIKLPADFRKIKIKASDADGLNEVKLQVENDSTSRTQITKRNIITRYNSKSFGITEIEFYDVKGKKLPVRTMPVKKANIQPTFITSPVERFYAFDGNPTTSAQFTKGNMEGKLVMIFNDFAPFTKLRIYTGATEFLGYSPTSEISFQINGKKEQRYVLKNGLNEFEMSQPYVAKTFTLAMVKFTPGNTEGGISEIQGYDGARWYSIEPDSLYRNWEFMKDSLNNTPAYSLLNNEITYLNEYVVLNTDTYKVINPSAIPSNLLERSVQQRSTVLFRNNYTWEATVSGTTLVYGKKTSFSQTEKNMFGDYKIVSKSPEQVVFEVRCKVNEITTVDGKPGAISSKTYKAKVTITPIHLTIDQGLLDMMISY